MDILIKGMEEPKKCRECKFMVACGEDYTSEIFGYYCFILKTDICKGDNREAAKNIRLADCPLVALPEHGDLVDRSFLKGASYEIIRFSDEEANKMFLELIDNAPTIVEATNE